MPVNWFVETSRAEARRDVSRRPQNKPPSQKKHSPPLPANQLNFQFAKRGFMKAGIPFPSGELHYGFFPRHQLRQVRVYQLPRRYHGHGNGL